MQRTDCKLTGLKAQLISAQGNALGMLVISDGALKGQLKSIELSCPYRAQISSLHYTQGVALGYNQLGFQPDNASEEWLLIQISTIQISTIQIR